MKKALMFLTILILLPAIAGAASQTTVMTTSVSCRNNPNPCPEGTECICFPDADCTCAEPDPCSYYKCQEGTKCVMLETAPPSVQCQPLEPIDFIWQWAFVGMILAALGYAIYTEEKKR